MVVHLEQAHPDACVAACVEMVARARGEAISWEEVYEHDLKTLVTVVHRLGGELGYIESDDFFDELELWLLQTRLVVAQLSGPRYVLEAGEEPGGSPSRHGRLAEAGTVGGPFHTVVVVGFDREADAVCFLDPYYPGQGQPIRLAARAFEQVAHQYVVI